MEVFREVFWFSVFLESFGRFIKFLDSFKIFQGSFWGFSFEVSVSFWTVLEVFGYFMKFWWFFVKFRGFSKFSGKFLEVFREVFGSFQGSFWGYFGSFWKFSGKFSGFLMFFSFFGFLWFSVFRRYLGSFWVFWNLLNTFRI